MPGYDPRFWELPFDPGDIDALPGELLDAPEDEPDPGKVAARREVLAGLAELVRTGLTDKQRQIVELYFYEGRTQQDVAAQLGVSQQVVSRQLFGVLRNGRRIAATRRLCGYRVVRIELLDDVARRTAEKAWGDVFYWVPPDDQVGAGPA